MDGKPVRDHALVATLVTTSADRSPNLEQKGKNTGGKSNIVHASYSFACLSGSCKAPLVYSAADKFHISIVKLNSTISSHLHFHFHNTFTFTCTELHILFNTSTKLQPFPNFTSILIYTSVYPHFPKDMPAGTDDPLCTKMLLLVQNKID